MSHDPVNHPSHYNKGNIECIDYIEDQDLDFHLGNAVKYITRAGLKDEAQYVRDLEKAIWYIGRRIELFRKRTQQERLKPVAHIEVDPI